MIRALVFSLVGLGLIILLGPLQRYLGLEMVVLDVPLIVVLYMAMAGRGVGPTRQPPHSILYSGGIDWTGGVTGFLLGYLTDLLGGGLKGIHCLSMTLIFLFCVWAARHVYLAGTLSVVLVTFVTSVLASLTGMSIRWATGTPPSISTLGTIGSQAVLCAAAAPLLMRLFRFLDARFAHDAGDRGSLCQ